MAPQREWFEKDYYKLLGVSDTATQKEITRAYRKLARENHPDTNPGDAAAEERFKEISAAYDVIGDADKRGEYDEVRKLGPMAGPGFGGGGGGAGPYGPGGFTVNADDLGGMGGGIGDILGNLFGGRGRGGGPGPSRGPGPQRGDDLETELHLSFVDAATGVTTTVHLTSEATCHTCHGSGAKPGTSPVVCPRCHGRGVLDENQGLFSFSTPCPECGGRGTKVVDPCPTCKGTGAELRRREVKVRIPAGVHEGQRIRLKGRGGPGRNGGPAGDLYVICRVARHELFHADGANLAITVPVTFAEAALGANITVPTLEGGSVTLRLAPGTTTGRTFRVKGRGIKTGNKTGDLLVTVEVAVPQKLSSAERKAVEALAAAATESPRDHLGVS